MERDRGTKIVAIVALVIAVVGVSLGFASYSEFLNITSEATVSPDASTFNVKFSIDADTITPGSVTPTGSSGENATLSGTTISGLKANLTAPGEAVNYDFFVRNSGEYDAYLTAVTFGTITISEEVDGETVEKEVLKNCVAVPGTTEDPEEADEALVKAACADINVSIQVGEDTDTTDPLTFTGSQANITKHLLAKNSSEPIKVSITYADNDNRADGDFTVSFGEITLTYSSVDSDGTTE